MGATGSTPVDFTDVMNYVHTDRAVRQEQVESRTGGCVLPFLLPDCYRSRSSGVATASTSGINVASMTEDELVRLRRTIDARLARIYDEKRSAYVPKEKRPRLVTSFATTPASASATKSDVTKETEEDP